MWKQAWIVGFVLVTLSGSAFGQSWKEKYYQAQGLYDKDNYDAAFTLADESLNGYLAEGATNVETHAAILRLLSSICFAQQNLPKGLTYADKEIQLRETRKDTAYAVALVNKALFLEQLGENDKAIQALLAARPVLTQSYPEDHLSVLECSIRIATNYYFLNDYTKSTEWFEPALRAVEKKQEYTEDILGGFYYNGMVYLETGKSAEAVSAFLKADALYTSTSMNQSQSYPMVLYGKARAYQAMHQYAEAEKAFRDAQSKYETISGKTGEDYFSIVGARIVNLHHLDQQPAAEPLLNQLKSSAEAKASYASTMAALAALYHGRGDLAKADAYYREALGSYDKSNEQSLLSYAEVNLNLATLCADQGNTKEALERVNESQTIIGKQKGTQSGLYLIALNRAGVIQSQADNLTAAEASFHEAQAVLAGLTIKPDPERSILLNGLGEIAWRKGNYRTADSLFQTVIRPYETEGKSRDRYFAAAMNNLAASKQSQGRLNESLNIIRKSAAAIKSLYGSTTLAYGNALESEALLRIRLGDLGGAKAELDSAVQIYERVGGKESVSYANGLMSLGRFYQVTGDYTQAEPFLKSAREIIRARKGDQSTEYAAVQNALALLYQTLGNYRDAESALKEAKAIMEKTRGNTDAEYATVVQNLAALYQLEGAYDRAEPLLREALEIDRKVLGERHPHYAITLQNMATLYQKLGRRDEAQVMLEKVLDITSQQFGRKHPSYITTLSNLAALYQDQGKFSLAETTWKQSADLRKEVLGEDHPDYARSLYGLAGVYHAQGQWAKAKTYYEPVVEKYQKQVVEFFPALSEKEKSAFYAKIKPVFDAYQDFFVQYLSAFPAEREATLGKLYDLQLGTKAILLNATNKVRSRILSSGNAALQSTFRDWLSTKEQIVRYYSASQEERSKAGLNMSQLESRANDLEKQLSAESDAFRSQFEKDHVSWKDVRSSLADNEVAVEVLRIRRKYVKDSVYYVGLVLQKSSVAPEMIVWTRGAQLEGRKFKYHRNTIKYHVNDTVSYQFFWKPLEVKIKPGSTVYLSCDGVFNKVNFNSLYEANTKRFVIDDYRLHQLSNTRELVGRHSIAKTSTNTAALFGFADFNLGAADVVSHNTKRSLARSLGFDGETIPVLPATEKEVNEIENLLKKNTWNARNFKRSDATEEHLKESENPKLIHIATHGFFLSDVDLDDSENSELSQNPLFRSGVLLAGAGVDRDGSQRKEDGVLTAYEAMNLNLDQTELVVLSACETGLGEVRNGEGVYGLQRSFLVAGANTVLMSLWQVDDVATQELMNAFYAFWLSGTEKHEAFRKAQLQMKEKYQIPYFWGAFVLIGN